VNRELPVPFTAADRGDHDQKAAALFAAHLIDLILFAAAIGWASATGWYRDRAALMETPSGE
jgi:hypothetical protein